MPELIKGMTSNSMAETEIPNSGPKTKSATMESKIVEVATIRGKSSHPEGSAPAITLALLKRTNQDLLGKKAEKPKEKSSEQKQTK